MNSRYEPIVSRRAEETAVRPRGFGRREQPLVLTEAEKDRVRAKYFARPSRWKRVAAYAGSMIGVFLLAVLVKFGLPAVTHGLPDCDATDVTRLLAGMAREKLSQVKHPFRKLEITEAAARGSDSGINRCKAVIALDGRLFARIDYEVTWTERLISRYQVKITRATE
jgi:hypothetical protein